MHGGDKSVCWEWIGGLGGQPDDPRPYFNVDGKKQLAYRLVYTLVNGEGSLTDKELVRHKCDNSICCNPYHLEKGSHQDNEWDKIERNRNGGLPRAAVDRIRTLLASKNPATGKPLYTHEQLAEMYNVSRETITGINTGRRHGPRKEKSNGQ